MSRRDEGRNSSFISMSHGCCISLEGSGIRSWNPCCDQQIASRSQRLKALPYCDVDEGSVRDVTVNPIRGSIRKGKNPGTVHSMGQHKYFVSTSCLGSVVQSVFFRLPRLFVDDGVLFYSASVMLLPNGLHQNRLAQRPSREHPPLVATLHDHDSRDQHENLVLLRRDDACQNSAHCAHERPHMSSDSGVIQSYETEVGNGGRTAPGRPPINHDHELSIDGNVRQADGLPALAIRKIDNEEQSTVLQISHGRAAATSWESNARRYRKLLNTVISEATQKTSLIEQPLAPSQIGASHWTSSEKQIVFQGLNSYGPTNFLALSRSLPTKTEPEIHAYIKLLQDGATEAEATHPNALDNLFEEIPAAHEIDPELEASLNAAADALNQKVDARDARNEQMRYGNDWLIDEQHAASVVARQSPVEHDDEIKKDDTSDAVEASIALEPAAFDLLQPEALLDLSSTIFMNPPLGSEQNWHELLPPDGSLNGPAIFRTALEDLYSLVISLTRRLVQASLYQTHTRLRATDASRSNWQPRPEVREVDVKTAIDILGIRPTWQSYWAELPRRLGFDVYSDVQRYKDGRPGTKTGVKLTAREINHELRNHHLDPVIKTLGSQSDMSLSDFESDDLTDASASEALSEDRPGQLDSPDSDDAKPKTFDSGTKQKSSSGGKRKRAPSSSEFLRAEAQFLDQVDHISSREEIQRLWNMLGKAPDSAARHEESNPPKPSIEGVEARGADHWSRKVQHWSQWETSVDVVPGSAFVLMDKFSKLGREKRRRLAERHSAAGFDGTITDTAQAMRQNDTLDLPETSTVRSVDKVD